jgi:hypothetical protein
MGKWTQLTKQHESSDKRHNRNKERNHEGRHGKGRY